MKSQNYLFCGAFLVLQYIFALAAHLNFPSLQQNNLFMQHVSRESKLNTCKQAVMRLAIL